MQRKFVLGLVLKLALFCSLIAHSACAQVSVLTQRGDAARDGLNASETALTLSSVNTNSFGKLFNLPTDGYVYAQPLYVPGVVIPNQGTHNVVYIATQHNSVYAYDADGQSFQPLWQVNLTAVACPAGWTCTTVPSTDDTGKGQGGIVPEVGITGTPVIDSTNQVIYVVAKTKEVSGSTTSYVYRLHVLDITTGQERTGGPAVIQGQVPGTGNPNNGSGSVVFDPTSDMYSLQRAGLALVNGAVYIGFGSWGDNGPYHGWIFGYTYDPVGGTLTQTGVLSTTPNGTEGEGGVWMSATGPASDSAGNLYLSTGNGAFDGTSNYGDSLLKLTTPGLTIADYFTPYNQATMDASDLDLSSGGVTILPDSAGTSSYPHIMLACGKNGAIYVLDRDNLGQYNSSGDTQIIQELLNVIGGTKSVNPTQATYVDNCHSTAAYWQGNVYYGGTNDNLRMFTFSNGLLSAGSVSQGSEVFQYPGVSAVISANGSTNGIAWAIENFGTVTSADNTGTQAVLHAYDATNLGNELYNSAMVGSDFAGLPVKFTVPTVANGKVYFGTQASVAVYGLFSDLPQAPAPAFNPAGGTYTSGQSVSILDSGATIYYTTDGSVPSTSSNVYSGPIAVSANTVINAFAALAGYRSSSMATATYTINTNQGLGSGTSATISAAAGTPVSATVNTVAAGHVFEQRGNGTANVAVNYNFATNSYQDSPNLRVNGKPFSVAFWYRSTQNASYSIIWDNGDGPGLGYVVGMNSGYISVSEQNGNTNCTFAWSNANTQTNDGQWHHAAVVADPIASQTYVYRDGTLDATLAYCDPEDNTSYSSNQWYGIGRNSAQFDFAGDIDHFTTWVGAALTQTEVAAHMNGGMPEFASVGVWYEFENAVGQRVPDLGPNQYDGHVSPDATPLVGPGPAFQALVTDASSNPVPDVAVTFTAPASGASGTFTGGLGTVTVTTDSTGTATAPTFTANNVVGSYNVSASTSGVSGVANFSLSNQTGTTASATAVTLAAGSSPSTYGQSVTFTATVTGSGATPTGAISFFDGGTCSVPGSTFASSVALNGSAQASVTTSALTASGSPHSILACYTGDATYAASNGTLSQPVNPATVSPSVTASNKTYDGTTAAAILTRSLSGVVGVDDVTLTGGTATFADANVGTGKTVTATGLTLSGTTAGNYQLSSSTAITTANISAAPVTVTADAQSKTYGSPDPPLTYQVTSGSLFNGDSFTGALIRTAGEAVGSYPILQGTLALSSNYTLTYVGANLTILPAPVGVTTVTLNPSLLQGGNSSTGTVTLSGPAPAGGALINLNSDTTTAATVPATVTVLAGNTSANFTVSTLSVTSPTVVNISGSYQATATSAMMTVYPSGMIPPIGWSVAFVDSQETQAENGAASNAIDGNPATFWVTQWFTSTAPLPHEIQVNLGASYTLNAFQYLPRQDGCANGWISQYEFYLSTDGVNWGSPVATGTFNYGNLNTGCPGAGIPSAMQVSFAPATAQFIRLRALSEVNGNPWTSAAEIYLLGSPAASQNNSVAQVTVEPTAVIGGATALGTVTLANPAPFAGLQVALSSSDPSATLPASVLVPGGSNSATFNITTSVVGSSTSSIISASYNGGPAQTATLFVNAGAVIPPVGWTVAFVDSQEVVAQNGAATNAIDGNPATYWVTQWYPASTPLPHEIRINLGASYTLTAFQYLPRQDGCANGWINQYAFYVSTDGVNWGSPVASGTFNYGNLNTGCPGAGVPGVMQVAFAPTTGQYIRLQALSEVNGGPWTSAAEISVLGAAAASQNNSVAQLTLNPTAVVGGNSAQGTVTMTNPAPFGGLQVALSSSNPSATVPANVTVPAGSTSASFNITTSVVGTSTSSTISASYNAVPQTTTLLVNSGTVIAPTGWSAVADSQETTAQNGAAVNAIDGNPATYWVTQWYPASAPLPHQIKINLGASYTLTAFQYLARQDGCGNGWIKQYAFYVSIDGVNWGSPVATGNFNYGNLSTTCPGAGVPSVMQVAFAPATGQYVLLQALSEINGGPWTSAAEISVLGAAAPSQNNSVSQLTLNPTAVVGGNSAQGTVTLASPAPFGGLQVALASSDPSTTVPVSVTVPAGSTSATFSITTVAVANSTSSTISASYNGGTAQTAVLLVNSGVVVPQTGLSVIYVDSQETVAQNGAATNAIDGNPATFWTTQWYPASAPLPHEIQIDLGASYTLTAFQYLPRQDGCANGWIKQYAFYVSTDGVNWGSPVATGSFNYGNLSSGCPGAGVPGLMQVAFAPTTGQYIRLQALSEVNGGPWTSAAEISVVGAAAASQSNSVAQVTVNPTAVIGGASAQGTVTIASPAPLGGLQVALSSSDPSTTVPVMVTVPAFSTGANFAITTTAVVSSTSSTISASYNGGPAQTALLLVNSGSLISQSGWSVAYFDSEQSATQNGSAADAIDGNSSTFWVTEYSPSTAPLPHEIQINLGASHTLTAFEYLARQDGCSNGWIKQYAFYVSTDGVNWGSPVATGNFNYGGLAAKCPGGGVPPVMQVAFPPTVGQYIRLQALSEVNGHAWTAVAEINVLGD